MVEEERGVGLGPNREEKERGKREGEREGEVSPLRVCSKEKERKRERGKDQWRERVHARGLHSLEANFWKTGYGTRNGEKRREVTWWW
jgi:hypothetical protein